jgi:hypothetical protein
VNESARPYVDESARSCFTCAYWDPCSHEVGKCRRHAPAAAAATVAPADGAKVASKSGSKAAVKMAAAPRPCGPEDGPKAAWPMTDAHDWCGEWLSREAPFPTAEGALLAGQTPLSALEALAVAQEPPLDPEEERYLRNASIAQALLVLPQEKRDRLLLEILTDEERECPTPPDDFYERVQDYFARQRDGEPE